MLCNAFLNSPLTNCCIDTNQIANARNESTSILTCCTCNRSGQKNLVFSRNPRYRFPARSRTYATCTSPPRSRSSMFVFSVRSSRRTVQIQNDRYQNICLWIWPTEKSCSLPYRNRLSKSKCKLVINWTGGLWVEVGGVKRIT
jgi:hypothetical protein